MFHYFGTVTNTRGDSLPGWQVEVVQLADGATVVPIYSAEDFTPIASLSGITNRALADAKGNYDFFVADGTYSLKFYDAAGVQQGFQRYLTMYGSDGVLAAAITAAANANASTSGAAPVAAGLATQNSSILILGDSIAAGVGATVYGNGYSAKVARSILNANDMGPQQPAGYGYYTVVNMQNALTGDLSGITGTGTYSATGITGSRLQLTAGQYIDNITGRDFAYFDVMYDASASTGSLLIKKNGTTIATVAMSGTGLKNTFPTAVNGAVNCSASDVFRIEASGGTITVTGLSMLRAVPSGPTVFVAAQSGTAYQDYTSTAALDELAFYLNTYTHTSLPKVVYLGLGTNNIYNSSKKLSPADTITQIQTLITGLNTRASNVRYVLQIPPRAGDTGTWPVQTPGYTHADYVTALLAFASTGNYPVVRQDLLLLSASDYADGLHPTDSGHGAMASMACRALGIPLNPYIKAIAGGTGGSVLTNATTWNPPSIAAGASASTTVAVTGAAVGDRASASFSLALGGLVMFQPECGTDTVTVTLYNPTGSAIDLASGTLRAVVTKLA